MFGLVWKVMVTVATLAGGALAQRAIRTGWRAVTGTNPPDVPENPETRLPEAITYAVIAGAVLNVARVVAIRQAARYYSHRAGGSLPRAMVSRAERVTR